MDAPNNCWPANQQKFADALIASTTFRTLVELPDGPDGEVGKFVFGKRLTHPRSGNVWTADELKELRHYAMIYSDPERPFGKHLQNNACYRSHGVVVVSIGRLVLEKDLVDADQTRTGLTDLHDREWQNLTGTILDELLLWLQENGGPYPITNVEITDDNETRAENAPVQGTWQAIEFTFQYGLTQ